jgi:hypothetical protein
MRKPPGIFEYQERLRDILRDLEAIDLLIPRESNRIGCLQPGSESAAIIEHRKTNLLKYIQVICRDHLFWGNKLLDAASSDGPKEKPAARARRARKDAGDEQQR